MIENARTAIVVGDGAIGKLIGAWLTRSGVQTDVLGRYGDAVNAFYDVCIEAVGSAESFARCVELLKPNGQVVLVGNPNTDFCIGQKLYWQILRKQINVQGVWNSSYPTDWKCALEQTNDVRFENYISHRFAFEDLDKAFRMMQGKHEKYGKVMLIL